MSRERLLLKQWHETDRTRENQIRREERNVRRALNQSVKDFFDKIKNVDEPLRFEVILEYTTFSTVAIKEALDRIYTQSTNIYVPQTMMQTLGEARAAEIIVNFENRNQRFNQATLDYLESVGSEKITGINQTTKKGINKVIMDGVEVNKGAKEIRDDIRKHWKGVSKRRAETIARTEVLSASSQAQEMASLEMINAGFKLKRTWLPTATGNFRPAHLFLDPKTVDYDKFFYPNGHQMQYPRDPRGPASEIINCRCGIAYEEIK